jgi:Icc-related predicted phosphoesterase
MERDREDPVAELGLEGLEGHVLPPVGREHTSTRLARDLPFAHAAGVLQDLGSMRIGVVSDTHDHLANVARIDVALHGHDHRRGVGRRGSTLVFNPGECAGQLRGHNAVGILDLEELAAQVELF